MQYNAAHVDGLPDDSAVTKEESPCGSSCENALNETLWL